MNGMVISNPNSKSAAPLGAGAFSEIGAWEFAGEGWRCLHGNFREFGYSVEWHDFTADSDFDWSQSFHPDGVEICLNFAGNGWVEAGQDKLDFTPATTGFYLQSQRRLTGVRAGRQRHQFITIEISRPFLVEHVSRKEPGLHPELEPLLAGKRRAAAVSAPVRLNSEHQQLMNSLRHPPVFARAQRLWYQAKVLEVASALLYAPPAGEELFCQRQKRLNRERVQRVIFLLKENLAETPNLEEIGRRVGCSHFHLSRIFTQEAGKPIFQYLRELRMERAAELLRSGRLNVTQVALEVGYSSSSHFSAAFHEAFGCCPGLYPFATAS